MSLPVRQSWFHDPPSNTDEQQKAAEGEDDETQGHGLLAAQAINDPQSHKDTWERAGAQWQVASNTAPNASPPPASYTPYNSLPPESGLDLVSLFE